MLLALRNLPVTSSVFYSKDFYTVDEEDSSPPRKAARREESGDISDTRRECVQQEDEYENVPCRNVRILNLQEPQIPTPEPMIRIVRQTVHCILSCDKSPQSSASYEEVLEACGILIEPPFSRGDILHSDVRLSLEKFARESYDRLSQPSNSNSGVRWLQDFVETWEWYHSRVLLLRSILLDLDRVYILDNGLEPMLESGLASWNRFVLGKGSIDHRIVGAIEQWAHLERANMDRPVDGSRKNIKRLIKALTCLNSYSVFQIPFLAETTNFYVHEADRSRSTKDPVDFLTYAENRVKNEEARCKDVLPESGRLGIISQTEKCLWGTDAQVTWIAENALPRLLKEKDSDGIIRMHQLFSRVDALPLMRSNFKKFAGQMVLSIVQTPSGGDDNMVQLLLDVKNFLDQVVTQLQDKDLGYASTAAFESSFTSRSRKPAELIAKFIDIQMRTGQKSSSDEEHMALLKRSLELYRFTPDKDVFRTFYYRALAKRLLLGRSASDFHEKKVIELLSEGYDPEFGKGEDMFKDLELSRDLMEDFHAKHSLSYPDVANLDVNVLQYSSWPIARRREGVSEIELPAEMQSTLRRFLDFYKQKHPNRTLDWFHAYGTALVTGRFPGGTKELNVSLYQAVVLLLFQTSKDFFSYSDIKARIGLNDPELKRILQSLACGKKKVLRKLPPGKEVADTDVFQVNSDFTDPRHKVFIPNIAHQETLEENKATEKQVEDGRMYSLEAAIVRVMKGRKTMGQEQLKEAVIDAVKAHFKPTVAMIKDRIDKLIENEYIRRDEKSRNVFHYIS